MDLGKRHGVGVTAFELAEREGAIEEGEEPDGVFGIRTNRRIASFLEDVGAEDGFVAQFLVHRGADRGQFFGLLRLGRSFGSCFASAAGGSQKAMGGGGDRPELHAAAAS
jgi:hypothetical protein